MFKNCVWIFNFILWEFIYSRETTPLYRSIYPSLHFPASKFYTIWSVLPWSAGLKINCLPLIYQKHWEVFLQTPVLCAFVTKPLFPNLLTKSCTVSWCGTKVFRNNSLNLFHSMYPSTYTLCNWLTVRKTNEFTQFHLAVLLYNFNY